MATASGSDAWAVGAYADFPSPSQPMMVHWDGTRWRDVPGPDLPGGDVPGVADLSPTDAWVAGSVLVGTTNASLTEHWNGSAWRRVKAPSPGQAYGGSGFEAVGAASSTDVWAAGDRALPEGRGHTFFAHWDGSRWRTVKSPNPQGADFADIWGLSVISPNDVWAVGDEGSFQVNAARTMALHWNGTKWKVIPTPNGSEEGSFLYSVSGDASDDVWAVGYYQATPDQQLVEHWDGKAWSIVTMPNWGTIPYTPAVWAVSRSLVWIAGGLTDDKSGVGLAFTERWDGSAWDQVQADSPGTVGSGFNALTALSSRDAWAVGTYTNKGDSTVYPLIERYSS